MKSTLWTRWTVAGFFGVSIMVIGALPMLSDVTTSSSTSSSPASDPAVQTDDAPRLTLSPSKTAIPIVEAALDTSVRTASAASRCQLGPDGLEQARRAVHYQQHERADRLLSTLIDDQCLDDAHTRDQARFQHAYVLYQLERPRQVVDRLDALETDVPVDDYVRWLRANSHKTLGNYERAADDFQAIYDADDSPLHFKARARQAKSLVAAKHWQRALPVVEQIVEQFPDYPRRHRALYDRATILDELDRHAEAAEAYQQAHFEFPYKAEGQQAEIRLQQLVDQGYRPEPIDPEKRYEQYRQLSIDKFWPLAHELLTQLREDVRTEQGTSELENKILQRIALNTYHRHDFEGAAEYFEKARSIYEQGHEDGFSERIIYRFHNFSLARIGRFDEAREALETLHENDPDRTRKRALAEFYERYGHYEDAYQLYEDVYTRAQRRRWHFSYLKYKTGRFEEAYDNLRRLARYSGGETRAKYLYWAARSLERAGHEDEAADLFDELHQSRSNSYYGVQARNRLMDLEQRSILDDDMLVGTDSVTKRAEAAFDAFDESRLNPAQANTGASHQYTDPRTEPLGDAIATTAESYWDATVYDDCTAADGCAPGAMGFPFPTYGLTWNLGESLMDPRATTGLQPVTHTDRDDGHQAEIEGLDYDGAPEAAVPERDVDFSDAPFPRVRFNTDARIYWNGRFNSDIEFVAYNQGDMIGPFPDEWTAYDDNTHHGGLERAVDEAGDVFPQLHRAQWLWTAGWYTEARRVIRDVSLEFRGLSSRSRPSNSPHELSHRRWEYLIDNRRRSQRADYWGMEPDHDELRFPVPDDPDQKQQLLERQQRIHDNQSDLTSVIVEALQEVGDYHMVRQFALQDTWWLRQSPETHPEAHRYWKMAYPRAFPEQVLPLAEKHNVNPYMIWALMLVESSFNPDSISIADALGLLQVIPRTGLKIADLFGADDFGPFDLLEADNSIEQGIFYFSKLVRKFHGQELFAFAGYNGGPHRVSGWLDMRGQHIPLDEFIEEIPFDESRGYAKKVLRFLNIYLRLYEDNEDGLYVGQNVRPDYLEQPDF